MLDAVLRPLIDPPLNLAGRLFARAGVSADLVTWVGLGAGIMAAAFIALGLPGGLALLPLAVGRLADGLDGAIARATIRTDFGGFLDIVADFTFYGAVPLAFAARDPGQNGLAAAALLFAFYVNGASFLAFASLAAKRGMQTRAQGEKSLYFSAGLMEGAETIAVFIAFCLWPGAFPVLAVLFALATLASAGARVVLAARVFRDGAAVDDPASPGH
jgi:phosphatidylglycerophosphate synthase